MGIGCVLFGAAALGVIATVVVVVGALAARRASRSSSRLALPLGMLASFVVLIAALVGVCAVAYGAMWLYYGFRTQESTDPAQFQAQFGFESGDVRDVRGWTSQSTDSYSVRLRFRCAPSTIDRIVAAQQMQPAPLPSCVARMHDEKIEGWQPLLAPTAQCWQTTMRGSEIGATSRLLTYDAASGEVRYASLLVE